MKVNKRALADVLGITERTLTEWQEEGLPIEIKGERGEENSYDTAAVVAWHVQRALQRAGKTESQRDRESRLRGDLMELELAEKNNSLVPVEEIRPTWESRVLAAAFYMMGRQSRLAGILEATPGIEAKRELLKREDADFLTKLGVDGERMQKEVDAILEKFAAGEADAFLRRLSGHDEQSRPGDPAGSSAGGVG